MICIKKAFFTYYSSTKKFYGDEIGHETGAILHEQDVRRIVRSGDRVVVTKRPVEGDTNTIEFTGWHKLQIFEGRHPHDFAYAAYLGGKNIGLDDPEMGDFQAALHAQDLEGAVHTMWSAYMSDGGSFILGESKSAYHRTRNDDHIGLIVGDNLFLATSGIYE